MSSTPTQEKKVSQLAEPVRYPRSTLETIARAAGRSPSIRILLGHIAFLEQTIINADVLHRNSEAGKKILWEPLRIAGLLEMSGEAPPSSLGGPESSSEG